MKRLKMNRVDAVPGSSPGVVSFGRPYEKKDNPFIVERKSYRRTHAGRAISLFQVFPSLNKFRQVDKNR